MTHYFHALLLNAERLVTSHALAGIFAVVAAETLGAPVPGESGLIGCGLLAARGDLPIGRLLGAVWAATVLGDSLGYLIGRFGGRPFILRFGARLGLTSNRISALESLFRRRGPLIVVGARFVVVLRQLNGVIAGAMGMRLYLFLLANAVGELLWTVVWGLGAFLIARSFGLVVG